MSLLVPVFASFWWPALWFSDSHASDPDAKPKYTASSNMIGRNYEGANLALANFSGSNVSGSSFRNARLDYANLSMAKFNEADMTGVSMRFALVEFTDFSGVRGLTSSQLAEACLSQAHAEENLDVSGFDPSQYIAPAGCKIWEHVPRG